MKSPFQRWKIKVNTQGIEVDACWEWTGATTRGGYGHFRVFIDGEWKMYKAHRFSYEFYNNQKLLKEDVICHKCDNPKCVNPLHLFKGTHQDNIDDAKNKGRNSFGRNKKHRWLTFEIAEQIRQEYAKGGKSMKQVGELFGTSAPQVQRIVTNQIWRKVGTEN